MNLQGVPSEFLQFRRSTITTQTSPQDGKHNREETLVAHGAHHSPSRIAMMMPAATALAMYDQTLGGGPP
jgi:hypothetical protein